MTGIGREAFDRGDPAPRHVLQRIQARLRRLAVEMHRARAALAYAAAELRAGELQVLAQNPQQRRVFLRGDGMATAVDGERRGDLAHLPLPRQSNTSGGLCASVSTSPAQTGGALST